jgi:hypothetical protein
LIPKPTKPKTCLDMSNLPFGKTNRKQREDKKARKTAGRCKCKMPGCHKEAQQYFHHVIQKSEQLIDHKLNLIRLCDLHHGQADEHEIPQVDLFELIAHEAGITFEQLIKTLEEYSRVSLLVDGDRVRVVKPVIAKG